MKPFDINDIRATVSPEFLSDMGQEPDPMYIDWAFYNWGNEEATPEMEPLKATLSLDVQGKTAYLVVEALDPMGHSIALPEGADAWAKQQVKGTVEELLKYEGVTLTEHLQNILKGE